jgi:hypothetical protein
MFMDTLSALNHLVNFLAPALVLAPLMVFAGHVFWGKRALVGGWLVPFAIQLVVGCLVLLAGLVLLGRDGKMLTYSALVLVGASCEWLVLRGWRE